MSKRVQRDPRYQAEISLASMYSRLAGSTTLRGSDVADRNAVDLACQRLAREVMDSAEEYAIVTDAMRDLRTAETGYYRRHSLYLASIEVEVRRSAHCRLALALMAVTR